MATLAKRSASPSSLQSRKHRKLHSLNVSNFSASGCTQEFCQCSKFSSVVFSSTAETMRVFDSLEISNLYVKYNQDDFVPIKCFLTSIAAFVSTHIVDPSLKTSADATTARRPLDANALSLILHANLYGFQPFVELLVKANVFDYLQDYVVGHYDSQDADIERFLSALYWFSISSPALFFGSPKILSCLSQLINVYTGNISGASLYSIKILSELSQSYPQLIPIITESSAAHQDMLDVITKNLVITFDSKSEFFKENVIFFAQCMQHNELQLRAAELGSIDLLLLINEDKWHDELFDILQSAVREPLYATNGAHSSPLSTVRPHEVILRNKPFVEKSWRKSDMNRLRFISLIRSIKFQTTEEEMYIEGLISRLN